MRDARVMKILLVSFRFDSQGGAVAVARMLAHGLRDRGHRVVVATTHRSGALEVREEEGLRVFRFRPKNLYWVGDKDCQPTWKRLLWQGIDLWNPTVHRTFARIVAAEAPDLVHVHKLRGLSPAVWSASRAAGAGAVVQTCHDYELVSPEGTFGGRVGSWAARRALMVRPYEAVRRFMSRTVDAVTAPSRSVLDLFLDRGLFPGAVARVVPNSHGLTAKELVPLAAAARSTPLTPGLDVLYLGRLHRDKGPDLLCRAVEVASRRVPGLRLWLAGSGPLEAELRRCAAGCPAIRSLGQVEGEEKERLLASCHLLAVPSRVPETFGLVVTEAHARGKPVVASRVGALPELVAEGETGFLVPPGDEAALAAKLEALARRPERLEAMAEACLIHAGRYTIDTMVDGYLATYGTLMSRSRKDAPR